MMFTFIHILDYFSLLSFIFGVSRALASIEIEVKPYRGKKTANAGDKFKNMKNLGRREEKKFLMCDMNLLK